MRAIIFVFAGLLALAAASTDKKIVCYFGSWSVYRPGNGQFDISYIDPSLCTHLIYTFVGLTWSGEIRVLDAWQDLPDNYGKDGFGRFNRLRDINPQTKTLVAIGGWNEGSTTYSSVVGDPSSRAKFIDSAVEFVRKYEFDGFDVDWEYPNRRGGTAADKRNFVLLLKELRERFDREGLILSAAVSAAEEPAAESYRVAEVAEHLHFVNLMAYDLHGIWDGKTGIIAPLYAGSWETGTERTLNVNASVHYWLDQGAPAEKLILGVPFYGRGFTVSNPQDNRIGAPATQPSNAGPYTQESGTLGYNEICEKFKKEDWQVIFQEEQRVPYAFRGNQWVGYDDVRSLTEKAEFVKNLGLGGMMVWSLETDDFRGICGEKYPLLRTVNSVLRDGAPPLPTRPTSAAPTVQPTSSTSPRPASSQGTEGPTAGDGCSEDGYVRDPEDCSVYYYCQASGGEFVKYKMSCPQPLVYDVESGRCDYPDAVNC